MLNLVSAYALRSIIVNGRSYGSDLIIFPHKIISPWSRKEAHSCSLNDLQAVIEFKPDALVIGTGSTIGYIEVHPEVVQFFDRENTILIEQTTDKAVSIFNKFNIDSIRVVAALHLEVQ